MFKKLTLLILVVISLDIYSQVVIKDEIVLEEPNSPDAEFLEMPFYGRVSGGVNWGGIWWGWLKKVVIEAGGQVESRSCPNPCNACYISNSAWVIRDLPKGTPVKVTVYSHCVNGELVEAETRLVNTGTHEYNIEYYNPNHQVWFIATSLKFTATTPPGCVNANNYCDDTYFIVPTISFQTVLNDGTYGIDGVAMCLNNPTWPAWSIMANKKRYIWQMDPSLICFDRQHQRWQYGIVNNDIKLNWVIGYCPNNVPIGSEMIDDIVNVPPTYPCKSKRYDVERHLHYNPNPGPHYFFKSLLYYHEKAHMELFQEYFDFYYPTFGFYFLQNLQKKCDEFNPNDPNSINNLNMEILNAVNKALSLAAKDYNYLLSEDWREYTEEKLIHPRAVPHIQAVLNSIICP